MVVLVSIAPSATSSSQLGRFYQNCQKLADKTGGPFYLSSADASYDWPERGIYIFFDGNGSPIANKQSDMRICRIGTVGDRSGSTSTLWERLRAHRGTTRGAYEDGGNHRGSIFRKHVGRSIIKSEELEVEYPHWGDQLTNIGEDLETSEIREQEHSLELRVSDYIRKLPFLVVNVPGEPNPNCERALLEKNLIALVSQKRRGNPQLAVNEWLGEYSPHPEISQTGLWNIDYTGSLYSGDTVDTFEQYVEQTDPINPDPDGEN
jgi:hypothetical protein